MQTKNNKAKIINSLRDYVISSEQFQDEDVSSIQSRIEELFCQYKIGYIAINYIICPAVIFFEIVPEEGVLIRKIRKIIDVMEISLGPVGVRIIAPIPGKGTIGIEIPRRKPQIVGLKQILESAEFNEDSLSLPIACGINTENKPVVADLAKMPHLLIAGATRQGKTTFLNTLIVSLLYSKMPDEVKFLLIDPKMVEFSVYEQIKDQYLVNIECHDNGVINDIDDSAQALSALVAEMNRRYCLLKSAGCSCISEYNSKTEIEKLPYIIGIIDEYADLKMTLGKDIELQLMRLIQMSRAVGIHLIVATQRPSTNVITGAIKANCQCRIAFRVSQRIDSKTILDFDGANNLIGRGDMLLSLKGYCERIQAPFIDYDEINKICRTLSSSNCTNTTTLTNSVPEQYLTIQDAKAHDEFFDAAARLIIQTGQASTSFIQRCILIGYNRAGKIMDQLEAAGIIGPPNIGKSRKVLMTIEDYESMCFNSSSFNQTAKNQLDSLFTAVAIYVLGKGEASVADIEQSFNISSSQLRRLLTSWKQRVL